MIWAYILIFGSTFILGLSAIVALGWAGRTGQFKNMRAGSEIIFDEKEPVGVPTDLVLPQKKNCKSNPKTMPGRTFKV